MGARVTTRVAISTSAAAGRLHHSRFQEGPLVSSLRAASSLLCAALALFAAADAARAGQTKLEAHYVATVAGMQVGRGAWVVDIVDDQYSAAANGKTTGILQVFSSGQGNAAGRGTLGGAGKPVTSNYTATVVADKKTDEIRMAV